MSGSGSDGPVPTGHDPGKGTGRAAVLHPFDAGNREAQAQSSGRLAEGVGLARALHLDVVIAQAVPLRQRTPATLFGTGKIAEIGEQLAVEPVEVLVVDGTLTPVQQRNLERRWKVKVIDRTGLILEIFGQRARTREGVMQVELAALSYQRSRLVRSWTHLERQRGGRGFLAGPGESQIELDRRRIGERIAMLSRELEEVRRTRGLHRAARARVPYPVVALVGYTNAGKSTLFNRLTGAGVVARDQLFATLDPTMRSLPLPSGRPAILSDTVGFISDLPTSLVAAFRATLEEVLSADLILHVRDIAHGDTERQARDVDEVLDELGLDAAARTARVIEVWNKIDLLDNATLEVLRNRAARRDDVVPVSAVSRAGLDDLLSLVDRRWSARRRCVELDIDYADGALLAWLHQHGEVLARDDRDAGIHLRVALEPADLALLARRVGSARLSEVA